MSALIILTAFAAQAATAPGSVPADSSAARKAGRSTYVDVEGGAGYSSNPQLSVINANGAGFGRLSLHAAHARVTARSTTVLSAYASEVAYTNHYGSQQSLAFDARHDAAVSEKLRLFGDASAAYDENGQLDTRIIGVPNVPPSPGAPGGPPVLLPPGSDFLSVRGRTYRFAGHVGGQLAVSARDNLTLSSGVEHVVLRSGFSDTNYTSVPVSVAYDRRLSERTTIGARVTAEDTEYNGPLSFRVVTPQLTARFLLASQLSFNAAIGASFARVDNGVTTRHSTGVAAEANLCGQTERSQICARGAIDQQTATTAGPSKTESIGVDYSHRLDAGSTLQFSLNANHYSQPTSAVLGPIFSRTTYFRAAAAYTRKISNRWFGGVNLAGRKLTQAGPDPKTDVNASLFVRYRFGDLQ